MTTILLTGASGFIGSWVARALSRRPAVRAVWLLRETSDRGRLTALDAWGSEEVQHADLTRPDEVARALERARPDVLIHLAAAYRQAGAGEDAVVDEVNERGTADLFRAFAAHGGKRFVAAGTCFEYGHQPPGKKIAEDVPAAPVYGYARSKARATEALLQAGRAAGVETVVLRIFSPYGPLEADTRLVPQLIRAGLTGRRVPLTEGRQVRDLVFVEDVADAFVRTALLPALPRAQAVYNVCSGNGVSLRDLAGSVGAAMGLPLGLGWGELPYRPDEMMWLVGDEARIAAELGWAARTGLAEGLRRAAETIRAAA